METITIAINWPGRRYPLRHDEKGYYWEGMREASFRRKTRKSIEAYARHCDIVDVEVEPARS